MIMVTWQTNLVLAAMQTARSTKALLGRSVQLGQKMDL